MIESKILLIPLSIILIGGASGLEVDVKQSCGNLEPVVSLHDTEGGTVSIPEETNDILCIEASDVDIRNTQCGSDNFIASMEKETQGTLSAYEDAFDYRICSQRIKGNIKNNCLNNETKALSVKSDNDTLVAEPGYTASGYTENLCVADLKPENITLELDGVQKPIYVDGAEPSSKTILPPVDFPYIVSNQPAGLISTGNFLRIRNLSGNKISMTQGLSSSFLLPFSTGGYQEIEDEQKEINNQNFLEQAEPRFNRESKNEPLVKVMYDFNNGVLKGFDGKITGSTGISVRNRGLENGELVVKIQRQR